MQQYNTTKDTVWYCFLCLVSSTFQKHPLPSSEIHQVDLTDCFTGMNFIQCSLQNSTVTLAYIKYWQLCTKLKPETSTNSGAGKAICCVFKCGVNHNKFIHRQSDCCAVKHISEFNENVPFNALILICSLKKKQFSAKLILSFLHYSCAIPVFLYLSSLSANVPAGYRLYSGVITIL